MGTAIYYLKARFASETAATEAFPRIKSLLEKMNEAQDDWQTIRGQIDRPVADRFKELAGRHAKVFELLELERRFAAHHPKDVYLNFLAGQLDAPTEELASSLRRDGELILFHGEVWHFADWGPLSEAIQKLGAVRVAYDSDESIDPYDALEV